jgi:hypothetical protein
MKSQAQPFFPLSQQLLHPAAFNEISRMADIQVEPAQILLGAMGRPEVGGKHSDEISAAPYQRSRLYRAETSIARNDPQRFERSIRFDIFDDDPVARTQGSSADRIVLSRNLRSRGTLV